MAETPSSFGQVSHSAAVALINSLPVGLALLNAAAACLASNEIFDETVGAAGGGPDGIVALVVEADRAAFRASIDRALLLGHVATDCRLRLAERPDEFVVLTLVTPPPSWSFALLLAVRDIREQVRLERQVAQATKMQAVGQLAGGIAHDFNNILTAVLGLCDQLLSRHPPESADFDDIDQIRQNGNRAASLVRQLLAFARQQTLRPKVLEITGIIDELEPLLRRLLGTSVELIVEHASGPSAVRVDPGQLEQVIVNLAVNARDAMSGSGRLTIATRSIAAADIAALGHNIIPLADHVAIIVSDTGTGIPPEIAAKIFEPFFTTKPIGEGTGLGLSTVYGIVKQTDGFIFAENAPGGGTSFALYFPAAPPTAPPPPAAPPPGPRRLDGTVLLVEDVRSVRRVVEAALLRHGLGVVTAADAFIALEILEAGTAVDILVSDVVMPGMDGVALLTRARELRPGLHVVLMSGYAEPIQRRALDRAGVVFLAKPFAVADLIEAVHGAMAA